MKWIEIKREGKPHTFVGKKTSPKVKVSRYSFALNGAAIHELTNIYGNDGFFSIKGFVSECGNFIAFGAGEPMGDTINQPF